MRRIWVVFVFLFMLFLGTNTISASNVIIPGGLELTGEVVTPISSRDAIKGYPVVFKLAQNLVVNNAVVLEKGKTGQAVITLARKATYFGQGGGVGFQPIYITTSNDVVIPLTFETLKRGSFHNDGNMLVAAIGSGPGVLFFHGKNHVIPAGTKFKFYVEKDTDLGVDENNLGNYFDLLNQENLYEHFRLETSTLR